MPVIDVIGYGPVTLPDGMSRAEMEEALNKLPPVDTAPPPEDKGPGVLGQLWDNLKTPAKMAMELTGRPGEFVAGTIAGTLDKGLLEGLRRGAAAAFEPNLSDSQIQENTAKTLAEHHIMDAHPVARAVAGFAGDVLTDPTNLLMPAGFIRRGAIGAAKALGVSEDVAKLATGVKIGEAFQKNVVPKAAMAINQGLAGLGSETARLKTIVDPATGLSAFDLKRLSEGRLRAGSEAILHDVMDKVFQYTPDGAKSAVSIPESDRKMIAWAIAYPDGKEAALVAKDPVLAGAAAEVQSRLSARYHTDVGEKLIDETKPLTLSNSTQAKLQDLDPHQLDQIQRMVVSGKIPQTIKNGQVVTNPLLESLAAKIKKSGYRMEDGQQVHFSDMNTLKFVTDPETGDMVAHVSTKIPNYMTVYKPGPDRPASIFQELKPSINESKKREVTFQEGVNAGAPDDAAKILIRREQSSAKALEDKNLISKYVDTWGADRPTVGMRAINPRLVEAMPEDLRAAITAKPYLPEALAADVEKFNARLVDPDQMETLVGRGLKLFKALATSLNMPSYQAKNYLGNVANMYASGMGIDQVLKEYAQATGVLAARSGRVQNLLKIKTPLEYAAIKTVDGVMDHNAIMKAALDNGVFGHVSGYASELATPREMTPSARLLSGKWNLANPDNAFTKGARDISQKYIEDPAKLGLFVHELKNGATVDQAALKVKNVLFDYAELTDAEKKIRQFVPFYTWTRKNIPLQLANLAQRPGKVANQGRFLNLLNELAKLDDQRDVKPSKDLPEYMQGGDTVSLPVVHDNKGNAVVAPVGLPLFDLNMLGTDTPKTADKLASMASPFLRVPTEMLLQRRLGDGRPIFNGTGAASPLARVFGMGVQGPHGPIQKNFPKYLTEQAPLPFGSILRSMPYEGEIGGMNPLMEAALRSLGLPPQAVTPEMRKKALTAMKAQRTTQNNLSKQTAQYDRLAEKQ